MKKMLFILSVMLMSTNVCADTYIKVYSSTTGQYYTLSGSTQNNGYYVYKKTVKNNTSSQTSASSRTQTTVYTPSRTQATVYTPSRTQTTVPASSNTQTTTPVSSNTQDTAQEILSLVNSYRAANGLSPLTLNTDLSRVAQAKAEDMKNKNYFSHTSPTYGSPFDMIKLFGISYRSAGENIAKGQKTPQAVMTAWMNSSGHKKNILSSGYTQLGVGYVYNNGSPYWVQMFIG